MKVNGCTEKKAVKRAAEMVRRGLDTNVLGSCITSGNPVGILRLYATQMKAAKDESCQRG